MAIERVIECAVSLGLRSVGLIPSPIPGGDGNREFLVRLTQGQDLPPLSDEAVLAVTENHTKGDGYAENRTDYQL